jgi:hypothetical protein
MVFYVTCGYFFGNTSYEYVDKYCYEWLKLGWNPCQLLEQKVGIFYTQPDPNILVMKYWDGWLKYGSKNHSISDGNCNIINL